MIRFYFTAENQIEMINTLQIELINFANKNGVIGGVDSKPIDEYTAGALTYLMGYSTKENYTINFIAQQILNGNYYTFLNKKDEVFG